jgi:hypothetical protein
MHTAPRKQRWQLSDVARHDHRFVVEQRHAAMREVFDQNCSSLCNPLDSAAEY